MDLSIIILNDFIKNKENNNKILINQISEIEESLEIEVHYEKVQLFESLNEIIQKATGKWILILKANENIENLKEIVYLVNGNYGEKVIGANILVKKAYNEEEYYREVIETRVFRKDSGIGCNVELISKMESTGKVIFLKEVELFTYEDKSQDIFNAKYEYLKKQLSKRADSLELLYKLSDITMDTGMIEKSREYIELAYKKMSEENLQNENIHIYKHYIFILINFEDWNNAFRIVKEAFDIFEFDLDLAYFKAKILEQQNYIEESIVVYNQYFEAVKKYKEYIVNQENNFYVSRALKKYITMDYIELLIKYKKVEKAYDFFEEETEFNDVKFIILKCKVYFLLEKYSLVEEIVKENEKYEVVIFEMVYRLIKEEKLNKYKMFSNIKWRGYLVEVLNILKFIQEKIDINKTEIDSILEKKDLYNYEFMIDIIVYTIQMKKIGIYIFEKMNRDQIRKFLVQLDYKMSDLKELLIKNLEEIKEVSYLWELKIIIEVQSFLILKDIDYLIKEYLENIKVYISTVYLIDLKRAIKDSYGIEFDGMNFTGNSKRQIISSWKEYVS